MDWKFVPFVVLSLYIYFPGCIAAPNAGLVKRPDVVNIGALVAYDSTIGKVAKKAIELALEDVNRDSIVLNGTRLALSMMDTKQRNNSNSSEIQRFRPELSIALLLLLILVWNRYKYGLLPLTHHWLWSW